MKIQGPCKGDEGGPLYIDGKANSDGDIEGQTLVAIHSGSAGPCGRHNFPAWWTRVRNYMYYIHYIYNIIKIHQSYLQYNFQVSSYYDWILCVTKQASENHFHGKVESKCKQFVPKKFQDQLSIIDPFSFENKING